MMRRQKLIDLQFLQFFQRVQKRSRVRRRIESVETASIYEIARIEVPSFRLIKTAMSRRMPRRMYNLHQPVSELEAIAVMKEPFRFALKNFISIDIEFVGKRATPAEQIFFSLPRGEGESCPKAILFPFRVLQIPKNIYVRRYGPNAHASRPQL